MSNVSINTLMLCSNKWMVKIRNKFNVKWIRIKAFIIFKALAHQ